MARLDGQRIRLTVNRLASGASTITWPETAAGDSYGGIPPGDHRIRSLLANALQNAFLSRAHVIDS
jgi:hypothetical protein